MKKKNFSLTNANWKDSLPIPVFDENPEYLKFYDFAWDLARDHVHDIPGMPQNPYMDEAFINTNIWIWDTCFMTFFCKYAPDVFPGIETLNNFYAPLYGGGSLPKVMPDELSIRWGAEPGVPAQLWLHIPDNPPLFAWAEYNYAMMTGDLAHLDELVHKKQYLQKHFAFLEGLDKPGWRGTYTFAPTCWVKHENGYFWEGGRSGMDNTPRGRAGVHADRERPNHPDLLWIDAICQQALSAKYIAEIAGLVGDGALASEWTARYETLKDKVNSLYWDEKDGMYYDIFASTGEIRRCLTPASFWPLLAGIAPADRAERMCRALTDPEKLGGLVPWPSVSRDDPDFVPVTGDYWRGAVWTPTAYMGIKGLEKYGRTSLAREQSRRLIDHMLATWKEYEPHTIWECYSPTQKIPASHGAEIVRPDFCGWSALAPIALFIENVIGIRDANAFRNTLSWDLPEKIQGRIGVRNYTFGNVTADLICENGTVRVKTNASFKLNIRGREMTVPAGESEFHVR